MYFFNKPNWLKLDLTAVKIRIKQCLSSKKVFGVFLEEKLIAIGFDSCQNSNTSKIVD